MLICMRVTIPQRARASPASPGAAAEHVDPLRVRPEPEEQPNVRVLLVEDNPVINQIATLVLRSDPRLDLVAAASSVSEAVARLQAHAIDVILLDHDLPDGSAGDVLAALGDPRRARVVLHTGRADADDVHRRLHTDALARKGEDWRSICDKLAEGRRRTP